MEKDKERYLERYASPYFTKEKDSLDKLPHIEEIREFLGEDYSIENIRNYFFTAHNERTLKEKNYTHLAVPYEILIPKNNEIIGKIIPNFFRETPQILMQRGFNLPVIARAKEKGILQELIEGDILITHNFEIVDYCSLEDISKYAQNNI